jgi:hypothetical protein
VESGEHCLDVEAAVDIDITTRPSATRPTDHIVVRQLEGRTWAPGACQNIGLRSGEFQVRLQAITVAKSSADHGSQPIRVGYSRVHGYGVFAKADIPKHSLVIGELHS